MIKKHRDAKDYVTVGPAGKSEGSRIDDDGGVELCFASMW